MYNELGLEHWKNVGQLISKHKEWKHYRKWVHLTKMQLNSFCIVLNTWHSCFYFQLFFFYHFFKFMLYLDLYMRFSVYNLFSLRDFNFQRISIIIKQYIQVISVFLYSIHFVLQKCFSITIPNHFSLLFKYIFLLWMMCTVIFTSLINVNLIVGQWLKIWIA